MTRNSVVVFRAAAIRCGEPTIHSWICRKRSGQPLGNFHDWRQALGVASQFYFAFGANMCARVFVGRRGMRPLGKDRGRVVGFRSGFVEPGYRPFEPVFAGLVADADGMCWGGVYQLTEADAASLDRHEGTGYQRIQVPVQSELFGDVQAFAYSTVHPVYGRKPSRRYLRLILEGATEFALPAEVVETLRATPTTHIPLLSGLVPAVAQVVDRFRRLG